MPITLAGPPNACCWTGIKHTGTPEGRIEPLGGLDTYVSEPPANTESRPHKKVLLFLADAYGPLFINNRLLQDYFASQAMYILCGWYACYKPSLMRVETPGFIVLGPDYFFGVPVQNLPPDRDKVAWSLEALAAAVEVFPKWFEQVRATYGRAPPTSRPSDTLLSYFYFLGTETTKYIAVGKCVTVPRFVDEPHC